MRTQVSFRFIAVLTIALCLPFFSANAQTGAEESDYYFSFSKKTVELGVKDTTFVEVKLMSKSTGEVHAEPFLLFARGRAVSVSPRSSGPDGEATVRLVAHLPGEYQLYARSVAPRDERVVGTIPIDVAFPPLKEVKFLEAQEKLYTGTTVSYKTKVFDEADLERDGVKVKLSSSVPDLASFDDFGNLTAHKPGKLFVIAEVEDIKQRLPIEITKNPVKGIELASSMTEARTGDVIRFKAEARNNIGQIVADAPVHYAVIADPEDNRGQSATGQIEQDGRFVAETPGLYTVLASSGPYVDRVTVNITPRNMRADVEVVGHGLVKNVFTSDLWVWEGVDGRDYAVTGTWGANGEAYFWDVTDPSKMEIIDTVTVDARTVNDVKVSEDGRIGVITREGASNRKNGLVVLDVSNPRDVKILSRFDDGLTGGVHNAFIYDNHVYAINNGRRYDVINIEDPTKPYRVSRFELDTPGHSVHDVWIEDGIAYSSNWGDGLQLVDIGGATAGGPFRKFGEQPNPEVRGPFVAGGSPSNPVQFGSYTYPSGWNHAAFPFHSESTKKFYVLAGDEAFPYGLGTRENKPTIAAGWIHFVDFTDLKNPQETARYEVPEAGSHNFWVENDTLYAAFYNGGVRVVDLSGELMGDLYKQGREIALFRSMHSDGKIANAPMVWGPQPYKGNVWFADMNSGLWAIKLTHKKKDRRR